MCELHLNNPIYCNKSWRQEYSYYQHSITFMFHKLLLKYASYTIYLFNFQQITKKIDEIVTQGSNITLGTISIIPSDLEEQLKDFSTSGLAGINFTQYDDIVSTSRNLVDKACFISLVVVYRSVSSIYKQW